MGSALPADPDASETRYCCYTTGRAALQYAVPGIRHLARKLPLLPCNARYKRRLPVALTAGAWVDPDISCR